MPSTFRSLSSLQGFLARLSTPVLVGFILLSGGCAKSPSGGPSTPTAPDRLAVSMTLQQNVNPRYYYSFAFDDDNNSNDGPAAIVGTTPLANGVVGGSFTVLVQYRGGQFTVYRRTLLAAGTESLDRAVNPFVTAPVPATGNTISFVLDLNATTVSGARLFNANATSLDTNFVTTDDRRLNPTDNRPKNFDALAPQPFISNQYTTFRIGGNQTFTNRSDVGEPSGDVKAQDTTGQVNLNQLDIIDFQITVQRNN
jgi:hypothetical protein